MIALVGLAMSALLFGSLPAVPAATGSAFSAVLAWLSAIDLRIRRLPDYLTLPLLAAGLGVSAAGLGPDLATSALGAIAGYALIAGLALFYRTARGFEGIGLGDAKLLAAIGAWVGLPLLPVTLLLAAILGLAAYAATMWRGPWDRRHAIAFGPCLAAAGWLAFIALHLGVDPGAMLGEAVFMP